MNRTQPAELQRLTTQECIELLSQHHFGRVAFASEGLPFILPVNYVFEEPTIVVRTASGTKLDDMPLAIVAFEIDDADREGRWGWSVVARGPAFDISDTIDEYSVRLRQLPVAPLAPGERTHWLKISARELSGRRFLLP